MSDRRPEDPAPDRRHPDADRSSQALTALKERLHRARQSEDWTAYEAVWGEHYRALYTAAYLFCVRLGCDAATARQRSTDAIGEAWVEIGATLAPPEGCENASDSDDQKNPKPLRPGEPEFLKRLNARVIFRCKDRRRDAAHWDARHPDVMRAGDDQRDDLWERLVGLPATQEEDLMRGVRTRAAIGDLVARLATLRELCRRRPLLIDTVDAMLAYIRDCFVRAVPPGNDTTSWSLDALVELAEPTEVEATKTAMFQYLRERLHLKPNVLHTRMADIREHLENIRSGRSFDG